MADIDSLGHILPARPTPKITDARPTGIRWAVQPDGSKVLQFAQQWRRGLNDGGTEWTDVPTVEAVADGVAPASSVAGGTRNEGGK